MSGEKAGRITREVLEAHFHLPMVEVAEKFNVCLTYFKRRCRSLGIRRWPYRKVTGEPYTATCPLNRQIFLLSTEPAPLFHRFSL